MLLLFPFAHVRHVTALAEEAISPLCALGVAADAADCAAAFVLDDAAALGAGTPVEGMGLDDVGVTGQGQVRLDRLADRVGAGEHLVLAETGRGVAGDAQELLYYAPPLDAASPGQRYHAPDGLALGGGATAGFAHGGEDFEEPGGVLVDGDVERAAAGLHLVGPPLERLGTLALGGPLFLDVRRRGNLHLFLLADGEDLLVAGAVTVDGDPLAVGLVGQAVDLLHVFHGGVVGEVHRLGDGVVGVALEGGLHGDVLFRAESRRGRR